MDPEENGTQQDPAAGTGGGEDKGAKGSPDLKAENTRLKEELKAANKRVDDLQAQLDSLNESLAKALTQEDVEAAVKDAQNASASLWRTRSSPRAAPTRSDAWRTWTWPRSR